MGKIIKIERERLNKIQKTLGEKCACYVLISCSTPSSDGKMEVEMNYEGDESLAAYLIESAGQVFDDRLKEQKS